MVISMVPPHMHAPIAEIAIRCRTPLVNASYRSPAMAALNDQAKAAGVTVLTEAGLDPGVHSARACAWLVASHDAEMGGVVAGIDHLGVMHIIDKVHDAGGKVTHFSSLCGGLPAPECADNPLG